MTATLTRISPTQVELLIPIAPEEIRAAEERAFRRLAKQAKLPGFRPGKVPRKIFEQAYGAEAIADAAMEDVVPAAYAKAIQEHDLDPVDRPKMQLLPSEGAEATQVKATVEVRPDIALGTYKGLELQSAEISVTDADVERGLQSLARDRATLVPVDREARQGDVVTVDYEGKIGDVAFEGGAAKAQSFELSEGRFIPGFATGIAGMKSGESKEITAEFPADYGSADLAGKTATFSVQLHEVKEVELPPLDDDFAKAVSEHETAGALRDDMRARLQVVAKSRARRALGNEAVERLVATHEVDLPETLVLHEVHGMLAELQQDGKQDAAEHDRLEAQLRPEAERRVKAMLLLAAIAKAEKIIATPGEIQAEIQSLAKQYGQPPEVVRRAIGRGVLSLMDGIVRAKTIDFLVENAHVKHATEGTAS